MNKILFLLITNVIFTWKFIFGILNQMKTLLSKFVILLYTESYHLQNSPDKSLNIIFKNISVLPPTFMKIHTLLPRHTDLLGNH